MTERPFDLVAAKLESLKREMEQRLNEDIFRVDVTPGPGVTYRRNPWYVRWGWRLRAYFSTLWKALRGVELEEPREWD